MDLNGYRPEYRETMLQIVNTKFIVAVIKGSDSKFYLFSMAGNKNYNNALCSLRNIYPKLEAPIAAAATLNENESRYFGLYPDKVKVEYSEGTLFFQSQVVILNFNGEKKKFTVWSLELKKGQVFNEKNLVIEN